MFTFIDTFAGCGGLSLGLMKSGGRGLFAIERHSDAFATLRVNLIEGPHAGFRFGWPSWLPVAALAVEDLIDRYAAQVAGLRGSVDLICGGPPCQGYSTNGRRNPADPRNKLFHHYLKLVRAVSPKVVLLENVPGIHMDFRSPDLGQNGRQRRINFANRILRGLARSGYRTTAIELDATQFFVPQARRRYFIVGVRDDLAAGASALSDVRSLVAAAASELARELELPLDYLPTAGHALSDLRAEGRKLSTDEEYPAFKAIAAGRPQSQYQRLMAVGRSGPPSDRRLPRHANRTVARFRDIQKICRPGMALSAQQREVLGIKKVRTFVLSASRPAGTVTTLPDDMLHYSEPRILTVRESARLQSFPDWFRFCGPYTSGGRSRAMSCPRYTQVGNAVPVHLAQGLGYVIARMLEKIHASAQ